MLPPEPTRLLSLVHPQPKKSLAESLASLSEAQRAQILSGLTESQHADLLYDWRGFWARPNQLQPGSLGADITRADWTYWLLQAGRGFGKTRVGAETVREWVDAGYRRIHLVGATAGDVRDVMIEGDSGLLNCFPPSRRPLYEPSKRHKVTFDTGAVALGFSADEPERLRGPQCDAFWADELAAWRFGQDAWDNLLFGFRKGLNPRAVITTTPKPIKLVKEIIADPSTVITRGSSYENRANLANAFFQTIIRKYEGTRLGRQELLAELLEDVPGALWQQKLIDATRYTDPRKVILDDIIRTVIAVDPAVSNTETSDEHGIIVASLTRQGHVLIMGDLTCKGSPLDWARVVIAAFKSRRADRVVGEVNNGGDLVAANVHGIDPNIPFRNVRASRGKYKRAEPVAALYEQGRIHHVGYFPKLEEQMCSFVPGIEQDSPDHMDAMVWAVTELLLDEEQIPQTRPLYFPARISRY